MITLRNLSKSYFTNHGKIQIIRNVNFMFKPKMRIALLGGNGAGKSTLLSLISGTTEPDSGYVTRKGSVSWPVGYSGSFHRTMTGAQNIRFLARVYGVDSDQLVSFVSQFSELGDSLHQPLKSYSSGMKARLSFGISMGVPFDYYLLDEVTAVGDAAFKARCRMVLSERLDKSGAIFVSHSKRQTMQLCDASLVLNDGQLTFFDNVTDGWKFHLANQS